VKDKDRKGSKMTA